MKKRYAIPLGFFILLAAAFVLLRTPDTDPAAMMEKYTNEFSHFVAAPNGLTVHYRDQGNPYGAPIILLHGNAASLHTWEPLAARLGGDYRIITLTFPGHGLTGPNANRDYSYAGMAEAVDVVAGKLGLDHFVIGGNSMGGWVSWRYTLANPARVDALLLLDAAGMPLRKSENEPPRNLGFKLMEYPAGRFLLQSITPRSAIEKSLRQTVSVQSIVTEPMIDRYWELLRLPGNRRAAGDRAQIDRELEVADRVGEITAPTLILWGEEDQLIYATAAQTFHERMPEAEVKIYEGVGHLPMEETPDAVAEDIRSFLQGALTPAFETP